MAGGSGPWQTRVSFAPDGSFAYRPGQLIVRTADSGEAGDILKTLADQHGADERAKESLTPKPIDKSSFSVFKGVPDPLEAIRKLNQSGIYAQPNHVLFAHTSPGGTGDGLQANPFYANPFYANPFYANPFYANPFYANPFYANPFYANPFYANPFYANPNPAAQPSLRETGRRPSSARPAASKNLEGEQTASPWVAILDTGLAGVDNVGNWSPDKLGGLPNDENIDVPDVGNEGYLDPVAGHGTFIAGIIRQFVPKCRITVHKVLETYGDSDEAKVTKKLNDLGDEEKPPDFVNLSFGGYSNTGMAPLAEAITKLHHLGSTIVASAGNDGTSRPMYPAVLPHVVAVGALDHEGNPAPFTNYGPWVRVCTLGVEIESTFFRFDGAHPQSAVANADNFEGWAVWSGTSFAAPRVVAALAQFMDVSGGDSHDAVKNAIDLDDLERIPMLGKVIEPLDINPLDTTSIAQAYGNSSRSFQVFLESLASKPGDWVSEEDLIGQGDGDSDEALAEKRGAFRKVITNPPTELPFATATLDGEKRHYRISVALAAIIRGVKANKSEDGKTEPDEDSPAS